MGNGVCADFPGNFDQALGNQRAGDGRAEQVFSLIQCIGTQHREYILACKLVFQVLHMDFTYPQGLRLGPCRLDFLSLADIRSEGHNVALVGL